MFNNLRITQNSASRKNNTKMDCVKNNNNYIFHISNENIINDYLNDFKTKEQVLSETNNLINQCNFDLKTAMVLFKNIKEVNVAPNHDTYKLLIQVCKNCGDTKLILELTNEAIESGVFERE